MAPEPYGLIIFCQWSFIFSGTVLVVRNSLLLKYTSLANKLPIGSYTFEVSYLVLNTQLIVYFYCLKHKITN